MEQRFLEDQVAILTRLAEGDSPNEILADLSQRLNACVPGTIVGVTILDRTLQIFEEAVFPALGHEYTDVLRGIRVADKPGSCALAVYEGRTVESSDVRTDDRFSQAWIDLSLMHGMEALISIPARSREGETLGTLVVAHARSKPLGDEVRALADQYAALAGTALSYRRDRLKQELLIGELQHRVRNLFSTIGAVVYATLRSHPQPDAFRKVFDARLLAMARAHSLALNAEEADLRQLLTDTLAPYSVDHQIRLTGPRIRLTQDSAVAFSMAAHELATNAAKYGSLSGEQGTIDISWEIAAGEQAMFQFRWVEAGGPKVQPPKRQGFGQQTLHRSVASAFDGQVALEYPASGLVCQIVAPYSQRLGARLN